MKNNFRVLLIDNDVALVFECYADNEQHAKEQALDMYKFSEILLVESIL